MRDNTTMKHVRTTTTGYIEADMLGHTLNIAEEMSAKQRSPQRPHRNKLKGYTFLSRSEVARLVHKGTSTAPSACWRSLNVLKGKGKEIYSRVASKVRKLFLNGN